jgi:hypothetical protein
MLTFNNLKNDKLQFLNEINYFVLKIINELMNITIIRTFSLTNFNSFLILF